MVTHSASCEKLNLAEEIKKLSDRLMMLSSINAELSDYNDSIGNDGKPSADDQVNGCDEKSMDDDAESEKTTNSSMKSSIISMRANSLKETNDIGFTDNYTSSANRFATKNQTSSNGISSKDLSSNESLNQIESHRKELYRREPSHSGLFGKSSFYNEKHQNSHSVQTSSKLESRYGSSETLKNIRNSRYMDSFSKSASIDNDSSIKSYRASTFVRSKSVLSNGHYSSSSFARGSSVVQDLTERLKSLDDTPSLFKKMVNSPFASEAMKSHRTTSSGLSNGYRRDSNSTATGLGAHRTVPWPITNRRTKFRINQMSRDVPVGSPDSHQTVFLEEAAHTTKDCLLHLLEKYNGRGTRNLSNVGRHQSISVGYGMSDNLEYRSMNSLNAFFKRNIHSGNTVKQIQARITNKPI